MSSAETVRLWKEAGARWALLASAGLVFISLFLTWLIVLHVPPEIPLLYARPWGQQQLVDRSRLWLVEGGMFVTLLVTTAVAAKIYRIDQLIARITIFSGLLINFLLFCGLLTVFVRVGNLRL